MTSSPPADPLDDLVARVRAAPPRCGQTVVIGVDGRSGAGKSALARHLAARTDAAVLHLDGVYPGWDGLAATPARVASVLASIAQGQPGTYPGWSWVRSAPSRTRTVQPVPLLVVEGVGAGAAPVRPWLSLLVWLEVPTDVRKRRALARDGDAYAPHWDRWAAQETFLLASDPIPRHADVILDSAPDPGSPPREGRP